MARGKRFEFRLSDEEQERLFECAKMCNSTPTQYMRMMLWCVRPAKKPTEKYTELLEQLMKTQADLKALTAEMKLFHEVPSEKIGRVTEKLDKISDELLEAIQYPNEVFDPRKVWKRTLLRREVFED